jgi:beta-lactamase regulating signal transducer with metallopeptidase domain
MISFAQLAVARVLNTLPEGLLIAVGAWLLLRWRGRENSRTRFAVWFVALAGVVALPFLSGWGAASQTLIPHAHPEIAVPAFWSSVFFALWIAIAGAALARVIAGVWQVRQIRRGCTEVAGLDPDLRNLLTETNRPVRLLTSDKARVPAALGFRDPAIVLPAWALSDLSAAELRPILIHELAHLRRRDDWTNLLQKTIRALLFFHPAVWWIDARLSIEREMACDDAVLAATGNARAYAGCLIDLLEKNCARRGWTMAQAAVARTRDASVRIARILRVGPAVTTRIGRAALGVATSVALACVGIALCAPQFIEFAPMTSAAAQVRKPLIDGGIIAPSPTAIVPASFHPAEKPAPLPPAIAKHNPVAHPAPLRQVSLSHKRAPKPPVVMTRLVAMESSDLAAPMTVIFDSTEIRTNAMAQFRTASAEPPVNSLRTLQSTGNPALQIQIIEVIDPETGMPMQFFRIVFVVPQQPGSPAQSI